MNTRGLLPALIIWAGCCAGVGCAPAPEKAPLTTGTAERTADTKATLGKTGLLLAAESMTTATAAEVKQRRFAAPDRFSADREAMVREQMMARGVADPAVLAALRRVPRHLFVEGEDPALAYGDFPLPIGRGQTISQPYIVAFMTEALQLKPTARVLEIGTGSGYQAAILAEIVHEIDTIEIIDELARQAAARLRRLGYRNINVLSGDGYAGWPERAPYDAIVVTAAAPRIPPPLLAQLKPGGRLIIPVDEGGWAQSLRLVEKKAGGSLVTRDLLPVAFVPLTQNPR